MKLGPPKPGEQRYAVAIRDGSDLWLTTWVRCTTPKGEIFVMLPRRARDWNVHASYHCNGTMHIKSHRTVNTHQNGQALTPAFRGFERFVHFMGHGKGTGEVCDPKAFLITDYPQPSKLSTNHEHSIVSAGLNDGTEQSPVSKRPQ